MPCLFFNLLNQYITATELCFPFYAVEARQRGTSSCRLIWEIIVHPNPILPGPCACRLKCSCSVGGQVLRLVHRTAANPNDFLTMFSTSSTKI
jgi:hypothetical protein